MSRVGSDRVVRIACQTSDVRDRLLALADQIPIGIERVIFLPDDPLEIEGCHILLLEQTTSPVGMPERVYSIAHANSEMLTIVLVRAPRDSLDAALFASGAFEVVDDGPDLRAQLQRALVSASRVLAIRAEQARVTSDVAHREQLAALGMLASGVGHEVNNPCAAVLANATSMRDELESLLARPRFQRPDAFDVVAPEWLESLGDCIAAARRIHHVVRSLGILARRSDVLEPELVDVNEEVRLVLRLIGKEIRFGAKIELSLDAGLPRVLMPPSAVGQIITNLTVNALHALQDARTEDPWIRIRTTFDDATVLVEVADNGNGISSDIIDRIFDPFFTTKGVGEGTGLGLSIARSLIERMGGEIFVQSTPGMGASFRVVLPRADLTVVSEDRPNFAPPARDRLRVLVVDDDELTLRAMERSLRSHFELVGATSVDIAMEQLARDPHFDAILCDVVMPQANGTQLFETVRSKYPRLSNRLVFISGGIVSPVLLHRLRETGRPLLSKPVELNEMVDLVRRLGPDRNELTD